MPITFDKILKTPLMHQHKDPVYDKGGQVFNAKAYPNVYGDGVTGTDGAMTSGSATFTSAMATFTSADVGKIFHVLGAGAAGADLRTTISAYVNATTVTLAATAGTTVTGKFYMYGHDDYAGLQALINTLTSFGGRIYLPLGTYLLSQGLSITAQNVQVEGCGWSLPHPGGTNDVSPGLPLTCLQPLSNFPANGFVITWNNTALMILGGSFTNIAIDGRGCINVSNVGGVHLGNAAFFEYKSVISNGLNGSHVMVDQSGSTYPIPSTSQLWFQDFAFYGGGRHGIEFGASVFLSDVFINNFWISGLGSGSGIFQSTTGTAAYAYYVGQGTIDGCQRGLTITSYESEYHHMTITNCWDYGVYFKQTLSNGEFTQFDHIIVRDCDRNNNNVGGFYVDTGSHNVIFDNCVAERSSGASAGGTVGFQVVDGFGVNGVFIRDSCYATGNTVANFKSGSNTSNASLPPQVFVQRRTVADTVYTVTDLDSLVAYTSLTAGRAVTLPTAVGKLGQVVIIKDEAGTAGANNLTIGTTGGQTIDGAATKVINTNYGSVKLYSNNANWFTIP